MFTTNQGLMKMTQNWCIFAVFLMPQIIKLKGRQLREFLSDFKNILCVDRYYPVVHFLFFVFYTFMIRFGNNIG